MPGLDPLDQRETPSGHWSRSHVRDEQINHRLNRHQRHLSSQRLIRSSVLDADIANSRAAERKQVSFKRQQPLSLVYPALAPVYAGAP